MRALGDTASYAPAFVMGRPFQACLLDVKRIFDFYLDAFEEAASSVDGMLSFINSSVLLAHSRARVKFPSRSNGEIAEKYRYISRVKLSY